MSLNREETVILEVSKLLIGDVSDLVGMSSSQLAEAVIKRLEKVDVISEVIIEKMDEYQEE